MNREDMARLPKPGDKNAARRLPTRGQGKPKQDSQEKAIGEGWPRVNKRLDPTRYGDWEKNGRCIDF